jgi:hypothetical protein
MRSQSLMDGSEGSWARALQTFGGRDALPLASVVYLRIGYGATDRPTSQPTTMPSGAPTIASDVVSAALSGGATGVVGLTVGVAAGSALLAALVVFVLFRRKRRLRRARVDKNRAALELPSFETRTEGLTVGGLATSVDAAGSVDLVLDRQAAGTSASQWDMAPAAGGTSPETGGEWMTTLFGSYDLALGETTSMGGTADTAARDDIDQWLEGAGTTRGGDPGDPPAQ